MKKNNNLRIEKFNKLIIKNLSSILLKYYTDKTCILTVTRVDTIKNFTLSYIYISILNNNEYILILFNNSSEKIRYDLFNKIKINRIPKLIFVNDLQNKFF